MKFKKTFAWIASISLLFSFGSGQKVNAVDPLSIFMIAPAIVNTGISATEFVLALIKDGIIIKHNHDEAQKIKREIEKYKGLRSRQEATKLIIDVAPIKIYG